MAGQFSPQEQTYFNRLFDVVDKEKLGVLPGDASITFLLTSKLPQRTLGEIWALCDPNNTGYLTRDGWWKACRLIGWAQKGETVRDELMSKAGALPKFEGHDVPSAPSAMTPQITGAGTAQPPLTPADKNQYTRLFVSSNPVNGLLPASQAQAIFLKSGLPTEMLAQIWNLADTQQRGSLDLPDFVLAMYFIQHTMAGTFKTLPPILPAGLYEQASGGRPRPAVLPTSPIARQMTGGGMVGGSPTPSLMARQMTGSGVVGAMQPQRTGQSFTAVPQRQFSGSAFAPPAQQQGAWDIKPEEKQAADSFFDGLDTARRGYIEGDVAVPFMLQSGLPEGTLAQIWDLADIRKEGKLNKDEFAVAMYLINKKLGGIEPPQTLPTSLIPPSLRSGVEAQQNLPSQAQRDLFDLFADSPPATAGGTQQGQAQSQNYFASPLTATATGQGQQKDARAHLPGGTESFGTPTFGTDLMGDDDTPAPVPVAQPRAPPSRSLSVIQPQSTGPKTPTRDYSVDIGNARNSLDSTTRAVHDLEKEKAELEAKENSSASQLKEIELRLSSVRAQHDNETRIVDDLKRRTQEQTEQLVKLRSELIANESELSALRAEKDETEQALLRDKEEVRTMGKRMKEVQEETDKLKSLLEKMKKEARQQRGMVAIAKKQVQTVESGRDAVQKEMDEVAAGKGMEDFQERGMSAASVISPQSTGIASPGNVATAASIPLPATPQRVLSPVATGNASRSNNPFDRLGFGGNSFAKPPSPANNGASLFANAFGSQENVTAPVETSREAPATTEAHDESLSALEKATIGAGAAVAAVGTVAGVAVAGIEKAFRIDDNQDRSAAEQPPADTIHEIAQNVKEDTASVSHVDPTQNEESQSAPAAEETHAKIETPITHGQSADPFGMPSELEGQDSDVTPIAEDSSARSGGEQEDPFGMPAMASTGGFATAKEKQSKTDFDENFESNFDQGFGDDFTKGPAGGAESVAGKNLASSGLSGTSENGSQSATNFGDDFASGSHNADFGQVTSPTADMHLAPASEPKNEFDSAMGNADKPMISAIPPQMRGLMAPNMPERTASTQAIASSSSVGTPLSEFAPSTPRSPYTEEVDSENVSPVRPTSGAREEPEIDSDDDEAYGATSAPRQIDPESSDDEAEGPEDLDRARSPFTNQQNQRSMSATNDFAAPAQSQENPVPGLSGLGLGAPLVGDNERTVPAKEFVEQTTQSEPEFTQSTPAQFTEVSQVQQPSFESFSQTTQPQATEAFPQAIQSTSTPFAQTEKRRDPPPPPARSPGQSQSSNPFASFAAASAPQPSDPAASLTAAPQQASSASSFDDDFDFENLPSAQVSHGQATSQVETRQPATDFDDEFDDFGNDFEEIRPAAQQPATAPPVKTTTAPSGGAPQLPGFDDNFGLSKSAAQTQPTQGKFDNAFGFDDDFGSAFTPVPHANQQQGGYAPPSGPPPAQSQSTRPNLPVRPSVNGSKAQPDDLEDVKKLCNMGFDRSLVVEALEANGYDFSKTLNVLLT